MTAARVLPNGARLRMRAHRVDRLPEPDGRLRERALCGFKPARAWRDKPAPVWADDCERCAAKAAAR